MPNPVIHFEIAGLDEDRTKSFYGQLFDWQIQPMPEMNYNLVNTRGADDAAGINGGIMKAPHGHPFIVIYVQVENLEDYLSKSDSLGGQTVVPPTDIPNIGRFAFIKDPDENILGLFQG